MSLPFDRSALLDMLTYCRPAGSDMETVFTSKYIATLLGASQDVHGNWHVTIGESPILWSCHTDTVHTKAGRQTVHMDARNIVGLSRRSRRHSQSSCLGADDTAGVFLMRSMVLAGVPGHYVFHYGEEVGGQGSSAMAYEWPEDLETVRFAIALDRRGTSDVITHQGFRRTASEAFAESLAEQLNVSGLAYSPSSHGIYTDTAEYADFISECTNLSVGYAGEHGKHETLDLAHVESLFIALCNVDQTALVESRIPCPESRWSYGLVSDVTWTLNRCEQCQLSYHPHESDAADTGMFCSEPCETQYLTEERYRNVYLSDEFADVQCALLPFTRTIQ